MRTITLQEKKSFSLYIGFYLSPAFTISPNGRFDDRVLIHVKFLFLDLFWHIPIHNGVQECEHPEYGFYFYSVNGKTPSEFVICKGRKTNRYYMPWSWEWIRTSTLLKNGSWFNETKNNKLKWFTKDSSYGTQNWLDENTLKEEYDFKYTLKSGKVQERKASVVVNEREWRWRWFMWMPLLKKTYREIWVKFSDEVGEGTGSWKGGATGCGWPMLKNETVLDCLRRMERERKFN